MNTRIMSVLFTVVAFAVFSTIAVADSPKDVSQPDRHSIEAKGKIKMYRVQIEGMGLGEGNNKANAEVFIALDSNPKVIYTLSVESSSPKSNQVMADTLRDAYLNKVPVTLYHQIAMNRDNNFKILMVQMGK